MSRFHSKRDNFTTLSKENTVASVVLSCMATVYSDKPLAAGERFTVRVNNAKNPSDVSLKDQRIKRFV